jgi:hypothetical protein
LHSILIDANANSKLQLRCGLLPADRCKRCLLQPSGQLSVAR